jgi:hypothetical protein
MHHYVDVHSHGAPDSWGAGSIRLEHKQDSEFGKGGIALSFMGHSPENVEQVDKHHRAMGHVVKIMRDLNSKKHAVARNTAARGDAPADLLHSLSKHPDYLTRQFAQRTLRHQGIVKDVEAQP